MNEIQPLIKREKKKTLLSKVFMLKVSTTVHVFLVSHFLSVSMCLFLNILGFLMVKLILGRTLLVFPP